MGSKPTKERNISDEECLEYIQTLIFLKKHQDEFSIINTYSLIDESYGKDCSCKNNDRGIALQQEIKDILGDKLYNVSVNVNAFSSYVIEVNLSNCPEFIIHKYNSLK